MIGTKFGRLTVIHATNSRHITCKCECGTIKTYNLYNLKKPGHTTSCGCYQREIATKNAFVHGHGNTGDKTYRSWQEMRHRCHNPKASNYKDYGGRGIIVCENWRNSFEAFLADMGVRPASHSIERINNSGNYEPGNCKWATALEQGANRRNNIRISIDGVTKILTEWCRIFAIDPTTVKERINRGWDAIRAVKTPARKISRRSV